MLKHLFVNLRLCSLGRYAKDGCVIVRCYSLTTDFGKYIKYLSPIVVEGDA